MIRLRSPRPAILLVALFATVHAQEFPGYHASDFALTSPGALKTGLFGLDNPALLTYQHEPDVSFSWTDATGRGSDFNRWGLFMAVPHVGFDILKQKVPGASITDYRLSFGAGDRTVGVGMGFGWSGGDKAFFNRSNTFTLGTIVRADRYVSAGLTGTTATQGDSREVVLDVAGRPAGSEVVTLFADVALHNRQHIGEAGWSVGGVLEPLPGIRITGRYFDTRSLAFGLQISLGNAGLSFGTHYDRDRNHTFNTYAVRLGATDRTVLRAFDRHTQYAELNLYGDIRYRRFLLFDRSNTLMGLLDAIDAAENDRSVAGLAINMSGMTANREFLWEVRDKLKEFQSTGKHIVVFMDRAGIDEYHFASVADKIVLDPTGIVMLEGFVAGRTFLKGTLAKIGLGYDEWRFFKYKSAVEVLSRDSMSAADREQRQKLIEDDYAVAREEICAGRHLTPAAFDHLVNDETIFLPGDALARGLVDTLGRWEAVAPVIASLEGKPKRMTAPGSLEAFHRAPDAHWGEPPRIALIYALGACAMDEGISARSLVKDVEAATKDPRVKAVVLRVDSPGGDGTASDYIAEALRTCKEKKPVIVSQGYVAASGGYWLSMYADTIVAAPTTITGSVGVIGGWLYNTQLKENLGMTTDKVQVGKHADLGFGFTLPFVGIGVPDRNLTDDEKVAMERSIKTFYRQFAEKVALGRKMTFDQVDAIGQGRVWSGLDGKKNGLVDVLGGIETAIRIARSRAGIGEGDEVTIVEAPARRLFDPGRFMPKFFGLDVQKGDPLLQEIRFRAEHNGMPMPILPLDFSANSRWVIE